MSKRMFAMTLAIALMVAPFAAAQTAAPKASVVDGVKDFGTVAKGEKLDWSFSIQNTGSADLEILAVRPTCGCTVADFDKVIKPGQTGKITAHVDTTAFAGPISKAVMVETNDPSVPTAQLTITAIVKPYVEAYPAGFVRFNLLQGETATQAITLYSEEKDPFEIVKIESPQPWIKVDYKKAEGDAVAGVGRAGQNQYRVAFTVGSVDAKEGPISEKVRIITNSKHQPEYSVSVSGVIRPTVHVSPSLVNFGEVSTTDAAATRVIGVRSLNAKAATPFQLTKVESTAKDVAATFAPVEGATGEYQVTLKVAPTAKAGEVKGDIKIHTNDPVRPMITVPINGLVKAPAAAAK